MKMTSLPRCCHSHVDEWAVLHGDHRRGGQTDNPLEAPELEERFCTSLLLETPSAPLRTEQPAWANHPTDQRLMKPLPSVKCFISEQLEGGDDLRTRLNPDARSRTVMWVHSFLHIERKCPIAVWCRLETATQDTPSFPLLFPAHSTCVDFLFLKCIILYASCSTLLFKIMFQKLYVHFSL